MGVLNRREIQMPPPDEGPQGFQEPRPRLQIARRRTRLDIGRALPCAAKALVIPLRRLHRHADRRDGRVGPQPQIGAEHIALGGGVVQQRRHPPRRPDQRGPRLLVIARLEPGLVEQADQVDIRGIVELVSAHLAHRQRHHAAADHGILGNRARQLAAPDLGGDTVAQRKLAGQIGKARQRPRHLLQRPDPAQIGQPRQQRHPPLALPERAGQLIRRHLRQRMMHPRQRRLGIVQRRQDPARLLLDQRFQIGAAPARPLDQRGDVTAGLGQQGAGFGPAIGIESARRAG